jgi:hypothetical protein
VAQAELAHEALIGGWHRLGEWVNQDREKNRLKDRLLDSAHEWQKSGKRADFLYRGVQLAAADEQFGSGRERLPPGGKEFLEKSRRRTAQTARSPNACVVIPVLVLALSYYSIRLTNEKRVLLETQSALLKATEKLQDIGDLAKRQSQELFRKAEDLLKDKENPRAPTLALVQLSRALDRDRHNVVAAEQACTLLMNYTWCPPLTPPLRYGSESPILSATFDPDGAGNGVLAISQNGWLFRSNDQGKALVPIQAIAGQGEGKNSGLVSASFSSGGRALVFISPRANGLKGLQFCGMRKASTSLSPRLRPKFIPSPTR